MAISDGPSQKPGPHSADRPNRVLMWVVLSVATIPSAICLVFFFGKLCGTLAFSFFSALVLFGYRLWRRQDEAKRARLVDKLTGNPPGDDPRQMARWMR